MALCMVMSSAYSRSLPTGTPMAMRVTRTPSGLSSRREVDRGRLAFDVRVGREDDLVGAARLDAAEQALDPQLVGPDALQRRERAHQHVVGAVVVAAPLDGQHVGRLLHDADHPAVARLVGADRARVDIGHVVADGAVGDAVLDVADRLAQQVGLRARRLQDVEREALRALAADARQALQLLDEAREGFRLGHACVPGAATCRAA